MRVRLPTPVLLVLPLLACAHVPTQKDIERAEIHHDLGASAVAHSRPQEALQEFTEAVRHNPSMPEAHNALGLLYHLSYGRVEEARRHYDKALKLRRHYPEAWNNLGVLLAELGDYEEARLAFLRALEDPLYKTPYLAQTNLGWLHHLQGRTAEGIQLVRAALLAQPDFCRGHRELARMLESLGRKEEADLSWDRFVHFCPDQPESLFLSGQAHARVGRLPEARRALLDCSEKAGERYPGPECRARLAQLPKGEALPPAPVGKGEPGRGVRQIGEAR